MESPKDRDKILGTRRDLLGDPLSVEVFTWLRPVYIHPKGPFPSTKARTTMAGIVSVLEPAAKKEGKIGAVCRSLSKLVSTPLAPQYVKGFESIKRPKSSLLGTFISVVYARALMLVASSADEGAKVLPCFKDILASPAKFEKGLAPHGMLHEHFVGHLVTLAEIEAQLDPYFQKVLHRSANLFVETHRPGKDSSNPLVDPKSGVELLGGNHESSWWWLPTGAAFALTVWDQDVV
jgi:hypothetical protein